MNKFKNATKRIVAVATSTALISSAAFAGLGDYPTNFVKNGAFNGQVVMGAMANGADSAAATSIIDDLKAEFSGSSEKVKITYKSASAASDSVNIADTGKVVKLGSTLNGVRASAFDSRDLSVLNDETLRVGTTNNDYTQEVKVLAGSFEHSLRDRLEDTMSNKLFFAKGDIMNYTMDFSSGGVIALADFKDSNLIGNTVTIMGNDFTIGSVSNGSGAMKMTLLGGANKISLGEGESTTVVIDGVSTEVVVQSVASGTPNKVLLTVNGVSKSIDEFSTDLVGNVRIAVTDLVPSSRDSVKGYAQVVIGGSQIVLEDGSEVVINDEDISKIYDNYRVVANFQDDGTSFSALTLTYSWLGSNGFVLKSGEVFDDKVFNSIGIRYDGTNDVTYSDVEIAANGDRLSLTGETINGYSLNRDVALANEYSVDNSASLRTIGNDDEVPMFFTNTVFGGAGSKVNNFSTDMFTVTNDAAAVIFAGTAAEVEDLFTLANTGGASNNTGASSVLGIKADKASFGLLVNAGDVDVQYMYEMTKFKQDPTLLTDDEFTISDLFGGKGIADYKYGSAAVASKLAGVATLVANNITTGSTTITSITLDDTQSKLAMVNNALLDISALTTGNLSATPVTFTLDYDEADMTLDAATDAGVSTFTVSYALSDDELNVVYTNMTGSALATNTGKTYISVDNKDVNEVADMYGTIIRYDTKNKDSVLISVPDKQLEAKASLISGDVSSTAMTVIVDAADVDAKKSELTSAGNTIVSSETMTSTSTTFDITAPVLDSSVTGMSDMIVVGGPAVNTVAAALMGITSYDVSQAGVNAGEGIVRFYGSSNSVLVYGYSAADTVAAANTLNKGGLSGDSVNTQ